MSAMASTGFLESLSWYFNFPTDKVRYLLLFFLSFPLAIILRSLLHYSYTSTTIRHCYSIIFGVLFGWICFHWHVLYLVGFVLGGYLLLITLSPHIVHKYSLGCALFVLSIAHYHRMITNEGGYFTGPLMLMVQRVSYVAFAYHDGMARDDKDLNEDQRNLKITSYPSLLEYFSYNFCFLNFLIGPGVAYKDYDNFITGRNMTSSRKEKGIEPSPFWPSLKKLLVAVIFLMIYTFNRDKLDLNLILDTDLTFWSRYYNITLFCFVYRSLYHYSFTMAEAICNTGGLGFNGYTDDGKEKWDLVNYMNIRKVELGTNVYSILTGWNITTVKWLRRISYDRGHSVMMTNMLCAAWHGFYPGYYLSFTLMAIGTFINRKMRHHLWRHFQSPLHVKILYDITTFLVTSYFREFCFVTRWLLTWSNILFIWKYYYFLPVITVLIVLFVVPGKPQVSKKE